MANIGSLNSIVERGNSLQAIPLEQNEAARSYVELLRPPVDLIIIVSHAGLTEDQDLSRATRPTTSGASPSPSSTAPPTTLAGARVVRPTRTTRRSVVRRADPRRARAST